MSFDRFAALINTYVARAWLLGVALVAQDFTISGDDLLIDGYSADRWFAEVEQDYSERPYA